MTEDTRQLIERATVHLPTKGGLGVICKGGYILTAAHNIEWEVDGSMTLDQAPMQIISVDDLKFSSPILAVEPVRDIALLGGPDGVSRPVIYRRYQQLIESGVGVAVSMKFDDQVVDQLPVHVFTHEGQWLSGVASLFPSGEKLFVEMRQPIKPGTSGGPMVNDEGSLLGIVSESGESPEMPPHAVGAVPALHLPVWAVRTLTSCATED